VRREGVQWFRGGWLIKRVADWERLQRGVLRRAAKKGGVKEIEGLTYPEEEALPQRTTAAAWRTRVEDARSLADLALQVGNFGRSRVRVLKRRCVRTSRMARRVYVSVGWHGGGKGFKDLLSEILCGRSSDY
jgi:hypothetical protein